MELKINIAGTNGLAFLDTGYAANAVTKKIYSILPNKLDLSESRFYMIGLSKNRHKNKIKPIGNLKYLVNVEGESFNLTFHVVSNYSVDVVLANSFVFQLILELLLWASK